MFFTQRHQLFEQRFLNESPLYEITLVNLENQAGAIINGGLVVRGRRDIGGAHFAQPGASFFENTGNTEPTADLHQFAA